MKIVYAGNNQRGIECLKALNDSRHDIIYAIAQSGENGWYSSIHKTAENLRIPFSIEDKPNNPEFLKKLESLKPDLTVMCGYSKIVCKKFREIPKNGCINLHASALPFYRGAAPLNWALINGEKEIGLSIYEVNDGVDTGPIIAQEKFSVGLEDTIKDVLKKTLEIYPKMLLRVCDDFERGIIEKKLQNLNEGSYFTKRFPKDGEINWETMTDLQIHNLVRALTKPYPGAFFYQNNKIMKTYVWETELEKRDFFGIPGRVAKKEGNDIIVIAKNRGIKLKNPDKKIKSGEDLI